jgi:peroxiredoxin
VLWGFFANYDSHTRYKEAGTCNSLSIQLQWGKVLLGGPQMPHRAFTPLLFAALCLLLAACTHKPSPASTGKPTPDFSLADANGAPIRLSAYRGKVVLLDFWATWCGGCKTEIPWYVEFQDKYREAGLSAIGVSMDADGWKSVKPFLADHKLNYPVVIGNDDLGEQFGVINMPLTLLIDRNGKIAESHAGVVDKDNFESKIRSLLHENAAK